MWPLPNSMCPSCLQTTLLSRLPHNDALVQEKELEQTVPHALFKHISTRPSYSVWPPSSLISPSLQSDIGVFISIMNSRHKY